MNATTTRGLFAGAMLPFLRFLLLVRPRNLRFNLREHGWRVTTLWFVGLLFFALVFGSLVEFSFMIPFAIDAEFVAGVLTFTTYYARRNARTDLALWSRQAVVRPGRWVRQLTRRAPRGQRVHTLRRPVPSSEDPRRRGLALG